LRHEQIWAPWRLGYVSGSAEDPAAAPPHVQFRDGADEGCFLCQAAAVPADPDEFARRRHVVLRTRRTVTLLNRYPYNNGHLLIAPLDHLAGLGDLSPDQSADLQQVIAHLVVVLERLLRAEGFNIGLNLGRVAGAGLPGHLHWHVVPRWSGDKNFMPSIAGVNSIPQSLDALWEALHGELLDWQPGE